ncbi:MAG: cobalamin-dependent protein [Eggerthellaceae bacterium]|nr:cobalamin-dependent protein [Eggerthellaceae bacterium]
MNINQLHMLLALAESGSMMITARKLHVTQPALTYQINKIERELKFKVFNRSHTGTTLTREGRFFCDELRPVLSDYEETVRLARELARNSSVHQANIGTNDCSRDMATLLLRMVSTDTSGVSFSTVDCGSADVFDLLEHGVIDLWSCSSAAMQDAPAGLLFEKVFDAPLAVHVGKEHRLASADIVLPEDLRGETVFLWARSGISEAADTLRAYMEQEGIEVDLHDFMHGVPPMVATSNQDAVVIYDDGFLPPSMNRSVKIALDWDVRDDIGFAYRADSSEHLESILHAIHDLYLRYQYGFASEETQSAGRIITLLDEISRTVRRGRANEVAPLVQYAVDLGIPPRQILDRGLAEGMYALNEEMKAGTAFTPEMVAAASAMSIGNELLRPLLAEDDTGRQFGSAVIGTVKGDMHDIGKNLLRMTLKSRGIEVTDLGVDVAPEDFVDYVRKDLRCTLVLLSVSYEAARPSVRETLQALELAELRDRVFVMVGGSAVDEAFVRNVGADAYTRDASEAARVAVNLLSY